MAKKLNEHQEKALHQIKEWEVEGGYWIHKQPVDGRVLRALKRLGLVVIEEHPDGWNIKVANE